MIQQVSHFMSMPVLNSGFVPGQVGYRPI